MDFDIGLCDSLNGNYLSLCRFHCRYKPFASFIRIICFTFLNELGKHLSVSRILFTLFFWKIRRTLAYLEYFTIWIHDVKDSLLPECRSKAGSFGKRLNCKKFTYENIGVYPS